MKTSMLKLLPYFLITLSFVIFCSFSAYAKNGVPGTTSGKGQAEHNSSAQKPEGGMSGGEPTEEVAGNNLSFPVIWGSSEGEEYVEKVLRGTFGEFTLNGQMWYWWGTNEDDSPKSCRANAEILADCLNPYDYRDGNNGYGTIPCGGDRNNPDCRVVFPQQDPDNDWQAESLPVEQVVTNISFNVTWLDWGDNLESVDWYTRSKVRIEIVLLQETGDLLTQYVMRHLEGWGMDELWGLSVGRPGWTYDAEGKVNGVDYGGSNPNVETVEGNEAKTATIYTGCARLTVQKLLVARDDPRLDDLVWNYEEGFWVESSEMATTSNLIDAPIVNSPIWEASDGPGYFTAEINIKGKIIYGFIWDVCPGTGICRENDVKGDYRITFSIADECTTRDGATWKNYVHFSGTQIFYAEEAVESEESDSGGMVGGGIGQIDEANNLTYIDIKIDERTSGGGGQAQKGKR